ncbi:MAG: hypothetical protein Fur0025_43020 [Oscillatoriaceae cyanobacterium]
MRAFSAEFVIQDDARQHVFWMQRFTDPGLFPGDLIADYFQSVAPQGYAGLYHILAPLINPILLHKLLPLALAIVSAAYCFGVCWEILPVPFAGFAASILLQQCLWIQDGLISATPKAFVYPLLLAVLYHLLKKQVLATGLAVILLGLFYPQGVLICSGVFVLQLFWSPRLPVSPSPHLPRSLAPLLPLPPLAGLVAGILVLLPYALSASDFGPTIAADAAKMMPEFLPGGRSAFFGEDPWRFWFSGRGGIRLSLEPPLMAFGLLLPLLLKFPGRFPLAAKIHSDIAILSHVIISSIALFFAAHLLLFKLHLPSRYTQHSLRIVVAIAGAISLCLIIDALWGFMQTISGKKHRLWLWPLPALLVIVLIFYPATVKNFPWTGYTIGQFPALYQFLQQQPKDIMIASLSEEANNLPSFAGRSILVGREYAIPYHTGYYNQFRQRLLDLIKAQYSPDIAPVQEVILKYGIDLWLVDGGAFAPGYLEGNSWLMQYPETVEGLDRLKANTLPAITPYLPRCTVFQTNDIFILSAPCILFDN